MTDFYFGFDWSGTIFSKELLTLSYSRFNSGIESPGTLEDIGLIPQMISTIRLLRRYDYPCFIVSNAAGCDIRNILRYADLQWMFKFVVGRYDCKFRKPKMELMSYCREKLGIGNDYTHKMIYIGDSMRDSHFATNSSSSPILLRACQNFSYHECFAQAVAVSLREGDLHQVEGLYHKYVHQMLSYSKKKRKSSIPSNSSK